MSKTTKALAIMGVVAGLGVAALPMSSYAATDTASFGVQVTLDDYISVESATAEDAYVTITGVTNNGGIGTGTNDITVKTNNKSGYYLQISAAETDLKNTTAGETSTIPAGKPQQGTSAWGYKAAADGVTNVTIETAAADYAAVGTTPTTIATGAKETSDDGDKITLTFGATASASQAQGTYQGQVTVTATSGEAPSA